MKGRLSFLLILALCTACGRAAPRPSTAMHPTWDGLPLAPALQFAEPVGPGDLVMLLVDAHTGEPLRNGVVSFDSTSTVSPTDSLGRIRFRHVNPGTQHLLIRCPGYFLRRDSILMPSSAGLALLIQMRRRPESLGDFVEPSPRKPPNER